MAGTDYLSPYILRHPEYVPDNCRFAGIRMNAGNVLNPTYLPKDVVLIAVGTRYGISVRIANLNENQVTTYCFNSQVNVTGNNYIENIATTTSTNVNPESIYNIDPYTYFSGSFEFIGMSLAIPANITSDSAMLEYVRNNNPWNNAFESSVQIPVRWKGLEDVFEITVSPQS